MLRSRLPGAKISACLTFQVTCALISSQPDNPAVLKVAEFHNKLRVCVTVSALLQAQAASTRRPLRHQAPG